MKNLNQPKFSIGDTVITNYEIQTKGFVHQIVQRKKIGYKRKPDKFFFYYLIKKKFRYIPDFIEGIGYEYNYDKNSPTRNGFYRKVKSCRLLLTEKINNVNNYF